MEKYKIRDTLLRILSSREHMSLQIDVSEINDTSSLLNDIALDSIQLLEFIVEVENEFRISIDTNELGLDTFDKFSDMIDYIKNKLQKKIHDS